MNPSKAELLMRPIIGIENRTAQEVFDIMSDRIKHASLPSPPVSGGVPLNVWPGDNDFEDSLTNEPVVWNKIDVDALAQEIRRVDGNHSLGAGALAEALMPFLFATNEPVGVTAISTEGVTPELVAGLASEKVLAKLLEDGEKAQRPKSRQVRNGGFHPETDARFILACVKFAMSARLSAAIGERR